MESPAFITLDQLQQTSVPGTYGPGASSGVKPPLGNRIRRQEPLPSPYRELSPEQVDARIGSARAQLGRRVVILGHHYQRDEIVKHADYRGDSFKLSLLAAGRDDADFIVFCGVHFMAESADILSAHHQVVILPNLTAGCSMADMANLADVSLAWTRLAGPSGSTIVPVTYMNSAADLKAFCGERDGIVCTSSNAPAVLRCAYQRADRVMFFPDEHLGRNTADRLGLDQSHVAVWDPRHPDESLQATDRARLIVWRGFCSVHERFTVEQIDKARREFPDCLVIVHPECRREVVQAADRNGSTEFIVEQIENAEVGSVIAVGTEINLVTRLAAEHPDKRIFCLDPIVCPCSTMYRIHPAYLAWVLDNLLQDRIVNRISVDDGTAQFARLALKRMLALPPSNSDS